MFIGRYTLDGKEENYIYYNNIDGWEAFHRDTFSPDTKDIEILVFKVGGKTYEERKENARQLAINWQLEFSGGAWSYGELATICDYFEKIGKRYGLLKEFRENAIC